MNTWVNEDQSLSSVGDEIAANIGEGPDGPGEPDGEMKLMFGFVSLAGSLLVRLENATGKSMQWHLEDIARRSLG